MQNTVGYLLNRCNCCGRSAGRCVHYHSHRPCAVSVHP